jgi:hypothetical protein
LIKQLLFCNFLKFGFGRWQCSGFYGQVDFCGRPFLILFGQQGTDQAQATGRVGKQRGYAGSAFEFLVQTLQAFGGAHAHPMGLRQVEDGKALGPVFLGPGGQQRSKTLSGLGAS